MDRRPPIQRFIGELRRRHVPQTVAVYLVAAWAAIEFADVVVPNLGWPEWVVPAVIVAAAVGLPAVLVLAWVFDWGPEGLHRTDPAIGSTGGAPTATSPWLIALAVLVVGVGSALGVAALIGDGETGGGGDEDAVMAEDARNLADDADHPLAADEARHQRGPVPPVPPWMVSPDFADSIWNIVGDTLRQALGARGLDSLMAAGRIWGERNLAGDAIEILEPDTWRFGTVTPMAPGDSVELTGIARDSSGVIAVEVDGRMVAESDPPGPELPFETMVVAPAGVGTHTVEVVVRARAGEHRRSLRIILIPAAR